MFRGMSLFAICLGLALALATATDAMPLGAAKAVAGATPADTIVKVHGCHHYCRRGPGGVLHRHGPHCGRHPC
jgi:hypothetical protein